VIVCEVPGRDPLRLEIVLLDQNGTLTDRGEPIAGVAELLRALAERVEVRILSADTFGTLREVARSLGARAQEVQTGEEKAAVVAGLGAERCVAIGNGANDAAMLAAAALGIAVLGPEGAAGAAVRAADVVCSSIADALALLLDERALAATLRP
jgi:P-type E1-E2 ATPase